MSDAYVHGYQARERERLLAQANALVDLLHSDTSYPAGSTVLEAGCGTGAQTITLARNSPGARITSVDVSGDSIMEAKARLDGAGIRNVEFRQADVFALPFDRESFDHVFVCFVLEHLSRPSDALLRLKELLRPGGTITVIEGDHGSAHFHPESAAAQRAIDCLVALQRSNGGDAMIGRQLYPSCPLRALKHSACRRGWFMWMRVGPNSSTLSPGRRSPPWLKAFAIRRSGPASSTLKHSMQDPHLYRTAEADGVFCYTFFKAFGAKSRRD